MDKEKRRAIIIATLGSLAATFVLFSLSRLVIGLTSAPVPQTEIVQELEIVEDTSTLQQAGLTMNLRRQTYTNPYQAEITVFEASGGNQQLVGAINSRITNFVNDLRARYEEDLYFFAGDDIGNSENYLHITATDYSFTSQSLWFEVEVVESYVGFNPAARTEILKIDFD